MSYSSAVENFRFSTMDYCTVELVAVAKLHSTLCEKEEVKFRWPIVDKPTESIN